MGGAGFEGNGAFGAGGNGTFSGFPLSSGFLDAKLRGCLVWLLAFLS